MRRLLSKFSTITGKKEDEQLDDLPCNESMAMDALRMFENEIKNVNENDPKQMVSFLRKATQALGIKMNAKMEDAFAKIEKGEDPEEVAVGMAGDFSPEIFFEKKKKGGKQEGEIRYDKNLYEL